MHTQPHTHNASKKADFSMLKTGMGNTEREEKVKQKYE